VVFNIIALACAGNNRLLKWFLGNHTGPCGAVLEPVGKKKAIGETSKIVTIFLGKKGKSGK
jgi:hypothetical protein